MIGHAVTIRVYHDPGSELIDAAVPVIVAEAIAQAMRAVDAVLQVMGVTGIGIEVGEPGAIDTEDGPE